MANKKNKKNMEGSPINGNTSGLISAATSTNQANNNGTNATSSSNLPQLPQPTTAIIANSSNIGTTTPTNGPHNLQHQQPHQRLSSSSSQSNASNNRPVQQQQQQTPLKKTHHNDVDKTSSAGLQASQSSFRAKDHRPRDKEKEKNYRTSGGHHQNVVGGHSQQNQQNQMNQQRKKDKNRDHSSQSHRSGGYSNFGGSGNHLHHTCQTQLKPMALLPCFQTTSASASAPNVVSPPLPVTSIPLVIQHTKTVQTEPMEEAKREMKVKRTKPKSVVSVTAEHDEEMFKRTDPKLADTVMAFKEHDDWSKVELMCELLSFLSPVDLRLVANCIEGSVRCYTNQMRPVEKTSNCAEPTASLPQYVCAPRSPAQPTPVLYHMPIDNQRTMIFKTFNNISYTHGPPGLPPLIHPIQKSFSPADSSPSSSSSSSAPKDGGAQLNGSGSSEGQQERTSGTPTTMTTSESTETSPQAPLSVSTSSNGSAGVPQQDTPSPNSRQPEDPPVPQEPERFLESVRDLTSYVYILISVCASTNRKSAAKIADYVTNVLLNEKSEILSKIPDPLDKIEVLQAIGKIVAAIIHHPAVSVDTKIKYVDLRDGIRAEIEHWFRQYYTSRRETERKKRFEVSESGVGRDEDDGQEESDTEEEETEDSLLEHERHVFDKIGTRLREYLEAHTPNRPTRSLPTLGTFFITRFIGRQTEHPDVFSLEIRWSDGDRTFTQRTRAQLRALQHRLLDEFGQQRSEKFHQPGMSSSYSSFDEESRKLSASTSTMETTFAASGDRILPRLPCDATAAQIVQYINELSDLPARMMLSAVICEEFNGTRARTEDESRESSDGLIFSRWKNPRSKSPARFYQKNASGSIDPIPLPVHFTPFLYSGVSAGQVQTLYPSCSNCGGQHLFKECDKLTLLDKKVEHKLRLEPDCSQLTTSSSVGLGATHHGANVFSGTSTSSAVPLHPITYLDGSVLMNANHHGNPHFAFHQNQQHQLQMMNGPAPYRSNGHFEGPTMLMYGMPPQQVNNANSCGNSGGNGGNGF